MFLIVSCHFIPRLNDASHQAFTDAFLSGNLAIKIDRLEFQVAAAPTPEGEVVFIIHRKSRVQGIKGGTFSSEPKTNK